MIPVVPPYGEREEEAGPKGVALLAAEEKREVVSVALAARLLGKSRDTIYRWMSEGRLAGRKVGGRWLVYRDSVEAEWRAGLVEPLQE
ncbi:MAG TPA: helix-turn-helix domain-containing protein [Candidatus Acidoferrales bacterium]|nr:helix-turn-helix domain-containing protein [Candidatus Acidoferrales bacterium]